MAIDDDLNVIHIASGRALYLLALSRRAAVFANDDGIQDNDTRITLTAAQKQQFVTAMAPLIASIKNRAALLP